MKALILDGRIVDVVEKEFPVADGMLWMDCQDDCRTETHHLNAGRIEPKPGPTQEEINAASNAQVLAKLREIDIASVRSIREYLAAMPDAPAYLKAKETAALAERAKLK